MNILFLAHNINIHSRTGDAIHVCELAENLAALGNYITLVAGSNPYPKLEEKSVIKIPGVNIQYIQKPTFKIPRIRDISTLIFCLRIAKKNPLDIIYERNFSCKIGVLLSKILGIPLIVEINGLVDEEAQMQGKKESSLRRRAGRIMRQLLFRQANRIVAVTQGIKDNLVKSYSINHKAIEVIPNGANINLFKPLDQETVKAELGLIQQYKYVCFVGNLAPWQGVEFLMEAAPLVIEKVPETRFLIVGDGMMYESLQNLVKEYHLEKYFYFMGRISYNVVPKYINASDICVAPFIRARNEKIGLSPLKIYEYMACGKTVVGSNINGVGDFLEKSNAGISFHAENAVELADAIIRLLTDDEMRENMGRNGMKIVNERFSWNNTSKSIVSLCKNIIEQKVRL
jgi:glycosyltransferase involved in cell wall biosynthesis